MEASAPDRTDPAGEAPRPWAWVGICAGGAVFSVLVSGGVGRYSNPPRFYPEWGFSWATGIAAICFCLWCSAYRCRGREERFALGAAILLCVPSLLVPLQAYFDSFQELPWTPIIAFLLFLMVAGWKSGQRWLSLAVWLFAGVWSSLSLRAPSSRLPATTSGGGVTLTVNTLEQKSGSVCVGFTVRTPPGRRAVDALARVRLEGCAGGMMPFVCWPAHEWDIQLMDRADEARMVAWVFPPHWMRSMDLTFRIQLVPPQPAVEVSVPVPSTALRSAVGPVTAEGAGVHLTVSDVRRTQPVGQPARHPVSLRVLCQSEPNGSGISGTTELRAENESGHRLELRDSSFAEDRTLETTETEIVDLPRSARRFRICAYRPEQFDPWERELRINGLPIPR